MRLLWKWLMIVVSILILITGLLTFPLPFPIGLPLLLLGLALLLRHSSDAKRYLVKLSRRFPQLYRFLGNRKKAFNATAKDNID